MALASYMELSEPCAHSWDAENRVVVETALLVYPTARGKPARVYCVECLADRLELAQVPRP